MRASGSLLPPPAPLTGAEVHAGCSCGPLSPQCLLYFEMEACFYECDHNIGKYRKYPTCVDSKGEQNAWQIVDMPLSSTMVDAWYNACANDLFCTGDSGSYFDLPSLTCIKPNSSQTETTTCRKFSNIYANSSDMITRMWDNSFAYGGPTDFVFPQRGAAPFDNINVINPNNAIAANSGKTNPLFCPFRTVVDPKAQALSDFALYVRTARGARSLLGR